MNTKTIAALGAAQDNPDRLEALAHYVRTRS